MIRSIDTNPVTKPAAGGAPLVDGLRFVVLLVLLAVRPLIGETFEPVQVSLLTALQVDVGPTPAATAWLDLLTLAAAADTLVSRGRWRRAGPIAIGVALLLVGVVLSSWCAGHPPLAWLAGSSLVIAVLGGAALCSLLRARWMVRLVIAALLAGGVTTAVKCALQRYVDNPQTQQQWETVYKPDLIRQGFDPDSPMMVNFERRMLAADAYGFLGHPNITGSCLALWMLVAMGLIRPPEKRCQEPFPNQKRFLAPFFPSRTSVVGLLVFALTAALVFTGSRGGLAAAVFGFVIVVLLTRRPEWFARHARPVLAVLVGLYVAVVAGVATYGMVRGTLPHPSLAFRWYYWTTAARAYQDAPLTGIGRGEFATAYARYKPAESTEEVRDPHNLWVSLLTELGPLALAGGMLLCLGCVRGGLRSLRPAHETPPTADAPPTAALIGTVVGPPLLHAIFSGTPFGQPGMPVVWAQEIVAPWLFTVPLILWLLRSPTGTVRGTPWLGVGLCATMLAALAHALLDFALLTPGGLAVFVLCAAAAGGLAGIGAKPTDAGPRRLGLLAGVVGGLLVLGQGLGVTLPTARVVAGLEALKRAATTPPPAGPQAVLAIAREIEERRPRDPILPRTAAQALLRIATGATFDPQQEAEWLTTARRLADVACARDPHDTTNYAVLAAIDEELAWYRESNGDAADVRRAWTDAASAWQRAVELYPTNPRARISAGRAWLELWQRDGQAEHAERARAHFEAALHIDNQRPPQDTVRLRPKELEEIAEGMRKLEAAAQTVTQPSEE